MLFWNIPRIYHPGRYFFRPNVNPPHLKTPGGCQIQFGLGSKSVGRGVKKSHVHLSDTHKEYLALPWVVVKVSCFMHYLPGLYGGCWHPSSGSWVVDKKPTWNRIKLLVFLDCCYVLWGGGIVSPSLMWGSGGNHSDGEGSISGGRGVKGGGYSRGRGHSIIDPALPFVLRSRWHCKFYQNQQQFFWVF